MRERNSKYLNNVGDLIEEIKNQDLESVNGGKDIKTIVTPNPVVPPVSFMPSVPGLPSVTVQMSCNKSIDIPCIEFPVLTIKADCLTDK